MRTNLAFSFDSTPAKSVSWNPYADLNNDGRITILDAATLAFYFDKGC